METDIKAVTNKLHVGCGHRRLPGWLNYDRELDLRKPLPFASDMFDAVLAHHIVEHLELEAHVLPMLRELRRVTVPGGHLWIATPDMRKVCEAYLGLRGSLEELLLGRQSRIPGWQLTPQGVPVSHMMNSFFHQNGEHINLFDQDLMRWALVETGWDVGNSNLCEADLLGEHPEVPPRRDDDHALYVRAVRPRH